MVAQLPRLLDLAMLRSTRAFLRASGSRALSLLLGSIYALISVSLSGLVQPSVAGAPSWSLTTEGTGSGLPWWQTPALSIGTPKVSLFLPLLPAATLALSAVGVAIGGSAALLLLIPRLRRGARAGPRDPLPGAGVAAASCTGLAGGASLGVAPTVAVAAIGAGCCAGSAGSAGIVVATAGGSAMGTVLFGMLVMDIFQISVLWASLIVQELELRRGGQASKGPGVPVGRAYILGTGVRVALLVAGATGILALALELASVSPLTVGAAMWYHWLFEELLLSAVAIVVAFFPVGVARAVDRASHRLVDRAALWEVRGALLVAGITWGTFVPPVLVSMGLGGLGNSLLGYFGVASAWASPSPGPLDVALLFHWTFQHFVLSALAILFALRPQWVLDPLLRSLPSAKSPQEIPPNSKAARPSHRSGRFRRSSVGKSSVARSLVLPVAALLVTGGLLVVVYETQVPGGVYVGQVRTYYVAANEVEWNYTPSGMNEISGEPFGVANATELQYTARNATYLGTTLLKCLYEQYPNASFSRVMPRPPNQAYLGLLGPVLYAVTGDTLHVVFRNNCRFNESIDPQGLASTSADSAGSSVPPGGTFTYQWYVAPQTGPGYEQPPSTLWIYASGTDPSNATDTGLVGPILVSSPGAANPNGTPVIPNIIDAFAIFSEGSSPYLGQNILDHAEDPTEVFADENNPNWQESLNKYSINGYLYGNQPVVNLFTGETYQWDLFDVGNDMHTPHWHGNTVIYDGSRTDVITLLPDQTAEAIMVPDDPGLWLFHCHVDDHLAGGMVTRYQVENVTGGNAPSGVESGPAVLSPASGPPGMRDEASPSAAAYWTSEARP